MKIKLLRYRTSKECTQGILYVDDEFECFTLEDTHRENKMYGETRIPSGSYGIKLRAEGGYDKKYLKKFPNIHKGMLWLRNVKNFEWIYIHIGNSKRDTKGCILVGNSSDILNESIGNSTSAYLKLYPKITTAIGNGEGVIIEIINYDHRK